MSVLVKNTNKEVENLILDIDILPQDLSAEEVELVLRRVLRVKLPADARLKIFLQIKERTRLTFSQIKQLFSRIETEHEDNDSTQIPINHMPWPTADFRMAQNGCVYFIFFPMTLTVKIGFSAKPRKRLVELQVGSPGILRILATVKGGPYLESSYKTKFPKEYIRGDWFHYSNDIRDHLREIDPSGTYPEPRFPEPHF